MAESTADQCEESLDIGDEWGWFRDAEGRSVEAVEMSALDASSYADGSG